MSESPQHLRLVEKIRDTFQKEGIEIKPIRKIISER